MSSTKRPHEDGSDSPAKRSKSDANGAQLAVNTAELIAKGRAEIAAKLASMGRKPTTPVPAKPSSTTVLPSSLPSRPSSAAPTPPIKSEPDVMLPPGLDPEIAKKIAEAKRRANASRANIEISSNPYLAAAAASLKKPGSSTPAPIPVSSGLKMAAHPLLLDQNFTAVPTSKKDRYKPMLPKFASIKANARTLPTTPTPPPVVKSESSTTANPYAVTPAPEIIAVGGAQDRPSRAFRFNQKGKYIQLGQQMRQEAQLDELKKRIAATARKAGLDGEFETLEKSIKHDAPPKVEWWDEALLPSKTYDDIRYNENKEPILAYTNVRAAESPITFYVQHPIPIPAPWDKNKVELNPLKLTKREMKKIRKQRRMAEMQDKQDRQKMGLIPPDAPKVRLANLMRVLTSDAVQDPTKVEAKVRREVAMRKKGHDVMNAERKLTDEQRREKTEQKKVEDEKRGIFGAVFKVKILSDPSHRFKVRKNAEQYGLTGICIFNPQFSLVIVEGSSKAVKQYSRLMLVRIPWTEAARDKDLPMLDENHEELEPIVIKKEVGGVETSLENNRCDKVWEGPLRDRSFNNFRAKRCPTDSIARETLGEKLASYWDVAKAFVPEEEL